MTFRGVHRIAGPPTSSAHAQFAQTYKIVDILPSTVGVVGWWMYVYSKMFDTGAITGAPMTSRLRYVILAVLLAHASSVIDVDDRFTDRLPPFSDINGQSHH